MECPLCGSKKTETVKFIDVEPVITEWRRCFQMDVRPGFHGLPVFELRACSDCALQFFAPDSLTGSGQLYEELNRFDWYHMPRKWEHDVALKDLRGCKTILEVGCGVGSFITLAKREAGLDVEGLEQNEVAVAEAKQNGLRVQLATVEEAAEQFPAQYDAVCSFQVLEHVPKPGKFLKACCTLLRPGGKLLLGLPNADSFLRHQFNPLDMPPHHMSKWPVKVFAKLPELFPMQLWKVVLEPLADYHVESYVDVYCAMWARGPLEALVRPGVKASLAGLIRRAGLRKWLRGQSSYAGYERN